jgi:diguanylate cyclase (GGDEF)-like protein/PAS domain S-box-containing protein
LADANFNASGLPMTMIDAIDDAILVHSGWPGMCQNFHRANPRSAQRCVQSDHDFVNQLGDSDHLQYKCNNGLWHIAIPIMVLKKHVATLFITQFFFDDEIIDEPFFINQAQEFGFDIDKYIAALHELPRFTKEKINYGLVFYKIMAKFIIDMAEQSLKVIDTTQALQEREEYRSLVANINIGVYRIAPPDRFVRINRAMALIFGYANTDELMVLPITRLYQNSEDRDTLFRELSDNGSITDRIVPMVTKDEKTIWASLTATAHFSENGVLEWIDGVIEDVSKRKAATDELRDLSEIDTLTLIYNRRMALVLLRLEINKAQRFSRPLSLIMLDIDKFKSVNDRFGHDVGDAVLRTTTEVIRSGLRKTDIFARYGGEEFVVVCPETDIEGAAGLAEKIRIKLANHDFPTVGTVTISAGFTEFLSNGDSEDALIKRADEALYLAKEQGRNMVKQAPTPIR